MQTVRVWVLAACVFVSAATAFAEAPKTSIRPMPRALQAAPVMVAEVAATFAPTIRPRPRPEGLGRAIADATLVPVVAAAPEPEPRKKGLFGFLRPNKRPDALSERKLASAGAVRILPGKDVVVSKKGSVCGVPEIKGETLAAIPGKLKGCGVKDPVRVTSVSGVKLSTAATINCETAKALNQWVKKGVEPVYGKGQVVELKVFASYACRGRNNKKGARISEHGRGNAIDIGGLEFADGRSVTVAQNFDRSMRQVHKAACGIFGTTLGPGSDGYHENHMHFDVVRYRNGTYCR